MKTSALFFRVALFGLFWPMFGAAVVPYHPILADPVLESWRWRHEEALDGLGVFCMDEAADGTLWFGGIGAIARYDGSQITRIDFDDQLMSRITRRNNPCPPTRTLLAREDGSLLAVIGNSLVLRKDNAWKVIIQDTGDGGFTTRLCQTSDGSVWLLTPSALYWICRDLSEWNAVLTANSTQTLLAIGIDRQNSIWITRRQNSGRAELLKLSPSTEPPSPETVPLQIYPLPLSECGQEADLIVDSNGRIQYVNNTGNSGLLCFDPVKNEWLPRNHPALKYGCHSLIEGQDQTLWAGGEGFLYALKNDHVVFYRQDQLQLPRVPLSLFEAKNGRLWVLGRGGYVYSVDVSSTEWTTYNEINFSGETADGVQWFLTKNRSSAVSHDTRSDQWLRYGPEDNLIDCMENITVSHQGLVWAAGRHRDRAAIAVFDGRHWTRFCHPEFAHWIDSDAVFEAKDGTMWFGAGGNVLTDSPHAGGALQYEAGTNGIRLLKHHAPPDFPYYVTVFGQTPDQTLWVGSTLLHHYDPKTGKTEADLNLPWDNTTGIVCGPDQGLWIAKMNFGVYHRVEDRWIRYTTADGLASLLLSDLLLLNDGSILAASGKGISRFDGKSWTRYAYPEAFAMTNKRGGLRQSSDGAVWFNFVSEDTHPTSTLQDGTETYYTIRYVAETNPPDTHITHYLKRVAPPGNSHIEWSAQDLRGNTPRAQLQYSWRLDGGEWSPFSQETSRTFLEMDNGRHVLEVRARDLDFNIDPTPDRIEFYVIPPIWQQAWFLTLLLLFSSVIGILIWIVIRNREQHLLEMDRLKTSFFTNVSHELRTPLTVVLGLLESLFHEEKQNQKKERLSMVIRNAQRISALISQLLDFRKLEAGKLNVHLCECNLTALMDDWTGSLKPLADDADLILHLERPENCSGWFDADKLQKIVSNLISNSIKYTPPGGSVSVRLTEETGLRNSRSIRLCVEDTGPGISAKHLSHIFERFYRVPESSLAEGSGIGLNLTRELAELMGGAISVESPVHSDRLHPGTRFTVLLPVHSPENQSAPQNDLSYSTGRPVDPHDDQKDAQNEKTTLLVVEDDADIRAFIANDLKAGYQLVMAKNGEEALQIALTLIPDLIVTDLMMPGMSGIELCRELKTRMETSHIPIIMLTAKASLENQLEGLQTGADDYVTKPFHMALLKARIANLLESRRCLREQLCRQFAAITPKLPDNTPDREFLEMAVRAVEKNYSDWSFRSEEFAAAVNMSLRTLQRKLKALADQTPAGFINDIRMKQAAALLVKTTRTVAEISFEVGYDEPSNFSRLFKKYYNMSPSRYRATHCDS